MTENGISRGDDEAARVRDGAKTALTQAFQRIHPTARVLGGYVEALEENLVDCMSVDLFCEDFAGTGEQELTRPALV